LEIEALEERTLLSVTPLGLEMLVNAQPGFSQTTNDTKMAVASLAGGGFVATYTSVNQADPASGEDVFARLLDANGRPVGNEIQVNDVTSNKQFEPAVAAAPDGGFLIAYASVGEEDPVRLPFSNGVFARRFDANGTALGSEFLVNTTVDLGQSSPSVGFAADGSFVIAWQSFNQDGDGLGIFAQRYDVQGQRVGGEIPINVATTGDQDYPSVAVQADGSFLVVFEGPDGSGKGIFARRFDPNGKALPGDVQLNSFTTGDQDSPAVTATANGYVVVWQSFGQDSPNSNGIFARRLDVLGTPVGEEFQVNSSAPFDQRFPSVAADTQGNFLVSWTSYPQDGSDGIYARQFSPTGDPLSDEFQVNTVTASNQAFPFVAVDNLDGTAAIVYSGKGPDDTGKAVNGVFARGFTVNANAADDFAQAPEVGQNGLYSFNSVKQTGVINQPGDRDIFKFLALADARQTVLLAATPGSSLVPGVPQVFDIQQRPVTATVLSGGVAFNVVRGETYYVAATGAGGSTGAYVLTFGPSQNSPRNGSLTASGSLALPDSLNVPKQLVDRLNGDAARDGFTPALVPLAVDQDGRLSAVVHTDGFAARLSLFDKDGNLLIQSDGQSPNKLDPLLLQQVTGDDFGTRYYLEVERLNKSGAGIYTLTTRLQPASDPLQPVSVGHQPFSFQPEAVTTADFNGDGIPDLAVGDIGSGMVTIFLGNGDGSVRFSGEVMVDPNGGAFPGFLLTADFNNDGKADLAVVDASPTSTSNQDVSILLGNGDGTFQTPKLLPVGGARSSLVAAAAGDFNGDGIMDLAVTDEGLDNVYICLGHNDGTGHGDGTFTFSPPPFRSLDTPDAFVVPQHIVSADLNGDGITDLAISAYDYYSNKGSVVVLLGNDDGTGHGDGTFHEPLDGDGNPVRPDVGLIPAQLAAADLNGDGIPDLVVVNDGSRNVSVLLGHDDGIDHGDGKRHGDGTFTEVSRTLVRGDGPIGLAVTDFNGDKKLDVAVANGENFVDVFLGDGKGNLSPAPGLGGFSVGELTFDLTTADLNKDGIPDLITADDTGNDVSISLGHNDGTGKGDGTFQSPAFVDVGAGGYDVAAGDVNGDGLLDVVTANPASGDVTLLLNNGDGTFRDGGRLAVGGLPYSVLLVDVNKDGKLDLVTANAGSNEVSVLLGNGTGFGTAQSFPTGGMMSDDRGVLASGDFNGDGLLDLAVANGVSGDVSILQGDGKGAFHLVQKVAVGGRLSGLIATDLNGDGKTDLAVTTGADGAVVVLFNNGNGTFRIGQRLQIGGRVRALAAADLNGDGKTDLAATVDASDGQSPSQVVVLLNNGNSTFLLADQRYSLEGFGATTIRAADISGDGKLDLVVTESGSASVGVLLGNGDGTFGPVNRLRADERPWAVAVGDFDQDGRLDLAVTDPFTTKVTVLLGLGSGAFQTDRTALLGTSPVSLASGDFNNDGQEDVVAANFGSNDVSVLLGNGDGSFEVARRVAVGKGPKVVVAADFNQDGRLDLAVADETDNNVAILLGNGDGTFRMFRSIPVGQLPTTLATADLNGDGRPDLVVGSSVDKSLTVLLGAGDGSFRSVPVLLPNSPAISLAVGDFDKDGVPDLAVLDLAVLDPTAAGPPFPSHITILRGTVLPNPNNPNNPNVAYQEIPLPGVDTKGNLSPLSPGNTPVFLAVAQLTDDNNDGVVNAKDNPDLIVADLGGNFVSVFLGKGDGTFTEADGVGLFRPVSLAAADLNGDGRPDLVTARPGDNELDLALASGKVGAFSFSGSLSTGVGPVALLPVDLNGDGRVDLVSANRDSGDLSVFLGLGDGSFFPADQGTAPRRATPLAGDFDHDGTPDVVVLARDGSILLRRGIPGTPGGFNPAETLNPGQPALDLVQLSLSGQTALAALDIQTQTVSLYTESTTGGPFTRKLGIDLSAARDPVTNQPLAEGLLPVRLAAGDLNGDGLDDLVVLASGAGTTSRAFVFLQNADGSFPTDPSYVLQTGAGPADLTLADLDGDGRLDIAVTNRYSGDVSVFLNTKGNPFAQEQRFRAGTGLDGLGQQVQDSVSPDTVRARQGTVAVVAGPFNSDKATDLVVLNRDVGAASVLLGDGRGGLVNPQALLTFNAGGDPTAVVSGDFNGDKILDLAVLDRAAGAVRIFLGKGDGTFTAGQVLLVGPFASGLSITDIVSASGGKPDGVLDLLVGTEQGDVLVLAGQGDGRFAQFRRKGDTVALAVIDIDHTGFATGALTASEQTDQAAVLRRLPGTTTFVPVQPSASTDPGPVNIRLRDVNGDNILDRVVVNSAGNSIQVALGRPDGTFGAAQTFAAGTNPVDVAFADLNSDGFLDLVVVNHGSNDVSVLFGSGNGDTWTLLPGPRLQAGTGPMGVMISDADLHALAAASSAGNGVPASAAASVNANVPGKDGILDLLVTDSDGTITMLAGIGTAGKGTGYFLDARSPLLNGMAPTIKNSLVSNPGDPLSDPTGPGEVVSTQGGIVQVPFDPTLPVQMLFPVAPGDPQILDLVPGLSGDFFGFRSDNSLVHLEFGPNGQLLVADTFTSPQLDGGLSSLAIVGGPDGQMEAYITRGGESLMPEVLELGPSSLTQVSQGGLTVPIPIGSEVPPGTGTTVASAIDAAGTRLIQALLPATLNDRTAATATEAEEALLGESEGAGFQASNPNLRPGDGDSEDEDANVFTILWRRFKEDRQIEEPNPVSILAPQVARTVAATEQGIVDTAVAVVKPIGAEITVAAGTLGIDLPAVATAIPPSLAEFPRQLIEALDRSFEAVSDDFLLRFNVRSQKSEVRSQRSEVRGQRSDTLVWQGAGEEERSTQETVLGEEEAGKALVSFTPIPVEQWVKASLVAAGGWLALWHGRGEKRRRGEGDKVTR
jgi:hypothetical protein